ncbi:hypothetical protein AB0H70_06480, partial [Streptomyces sp. NPDC050804]
MDSLSPKLLPSPTSIRTPAPALTPAPVIDVTSPSIARTYAVLHHADLRGRVPYRAGQCRGCDHCPA